MACTIIWDFIGGTRIRLPEIVHAPATAPAIRDDAARMTDAPGGHHGVRSILAPDAAARGLLNDHIRALAALHR